MPTEQQLFEKFNAVATATRSVPPRAATPWLSDLVDGALQAKDHPAHLLFGESHVNGSFLETYMMLAENPDIFKAAAKNGVRHLVLEFPVAFQKIVDEYARHDIDRDQFLWRVFDDPFYHFVTPWVADDAVAQFKATFADVIDNALESGLKVHFADLSCNKVLGAMPPEFAEMEKKLAERHDAEKSPLPLQQYIAQYVQNLSREEQLALVDTMTKFQYQQRISRVDDTEQFNYLRESIPAGEGIIGLFGYAHLDDSVATGLGLNSHLEREGAAVTTVELYNNRNTLDLMNAIYATSGTVKRKLPEYTIVLDEGAVQKRELSVADPAAARNPSPPISPPAAP